MRVGELLGATPHRWVQGVDDQDVVSVTHDSRRAGPGAVFVALRGGRTDGLNFAGDAARRGAGAVIVGRGRSGVAELKNAPRVIEVDDERTALAVMARNLHGRVDERLPIVGVTGTNGKTTTCCLVAAVLEAAGWKVGQLGTISYKVGDAEIDGRLTTPEAPDIHGYLSRMAAAGCGGCVMEVSSHSLDRRRVH
ncbi:MAG: Mur ligase family protein, partial [Acidobacteriota bacterium]